MRHVLWSCSIMLLVGALCMIGISVNQYIKIMPADAYVDKGVHSFSPYQVLPIQVENTSATSRNRRMNPTKTVYMVYYRATDGSGYQWSTKALSKNEGLSIVENKEIVERRVLSIVDKGTYITVGPESTAESYVDQNRMKCVKWFFVSVIYLAIWTLVKLKVK